MRRNGLRLCLTFLFILVAPFAKADNTWIEIKTQHFRVVTDAGEKSGRQTGERFEQMRAAFGLIFGRKTLNEPVPLTIIGFRSTKEFRQYCPIFQGKIVELSGFFIPASDENFVAIDMSREESWETVKHEYAHDLLDANYMATAPWFDEGFAEFFSSLKLTDTEAQLGAGIPEAPALLQGKKLGLQQLFEVEHHSETYNKNGQQRDMFYVQSWLVVHYIFDNDLVPKAARYFALRNDQQTPVPEAVQSAFGMSVPDMDKAVLEYLRANKVKAVVFSLKDQSAVSRDASARTLDPLAARSQLADLHLHERDYGPAAVKEFEAIIAENPNQVEAQRGLGYAYLQQQNFPKAAQHLQAAAHLGSKDPKVYFYTAMLLQQENPSAVGSPELVSNLRHAIELDPQYADAYAMLGVSLMNSGTSPAEAESNLARAVTLAPRNDLYRYNYGVALLNQQQLDKGKAMLTMVQHSSDASVAEQASQMLQKVNDFQAHEHGKATTETPLAPARSFAPEPQPVGETETSAPITPVKSEYLQGMLVSVDCVSPPTAVLTVSSGTRRGRCWSPILSMRLSSVLTSFPASGRERRRRSTTFHPLRTKAKSFQ